MGEKPPINVEKISGTNQSFYNQIRSIRHVHGTLNDTMILGVNDQNQIINTKMRTKSILNYIVKPILNDNSRTLRNESCEKLIANANVIVIFGMSLGPTDKNWWIKIVKHLLVKKDSILFIVNYEKNISLRLKHFYLDVYNRYISKLLSYYEGTLSDEQTRDLNNRIHVELNTDLFKFNSYRLSKDSIKMLTKNRKNSFSI